jgi:hypothetical protein
VGTVPRGLEVTLPGPPVLRPDRLRNPAARVLGVDRAEKLIDDARALAAAHAVTNAESSISTLVGHPGRSSGSCDDRSPRAHQLCVGRQRA